ncbi:hypothetical protein PoB_004356100 [Plakobranchus ocellatus]|uniref:Uncharacterized protein n=1 Tax=Plakobranchus ocellatus TaxID=259542 RepID=A0AAV4BE34_9GAST|nr:hypothetical protein PoB_004356100 [Plakobranchus ocellatus]
MENRRRSSEIPTIWDELVFTRSEKDQDEPVFTRSEKDPGLSNPADSKSIICIRSGCHVAKSRFVPTGRQAKVAYDANRKLKWCNILGLAKWREAKGKEEKRNKRRCVCEWGNLRVQDYKGLRYEKAGFTLLTKTLVRADLNAPVVLYSISRPSQISSAILYPVTHQRTSLSKSPPCPAATATSVPASMKAISLSRSPWSPVAPNTGSKPDDARQLEHRAATRLSSHLLLSPPLPLSSPNDHLITRDGFSAYPWTRQILITSPQWHLLKLGVSGCARLFGQLLLWPLQLSSAGRLD